MATSEAQKRASAKYRKRNVKMMSVAFYPKDKKVLGFVQNHGGSTFLRELAYKAMESEREKE